MKKAIENQRARRTILMDLGVSPETGISGDCLIISPDLYSNESRQVKGVVQAEACP